MKYILLLFLVVGALFFYRTETRITNLEARVQALTQEAEHSQAQESLLLSSQKKAGHKQKEQAELLSAVAKAVVALLDQSTGSISGLNTMDNTAAR